VLWGLHPHHWLHAFLQACADHGGKSPEDLRAFLPWQMTPERRADLMRPVPLTSAILILEINWYRTAIPAQGPGS